MRLLKSNAFWMWLAWQLPAGLVAACFLRVLQETEAEKDNLNEEYAVRELYRPN